MTARPKKEPGRNLHLLRMAQGKPCLFRLDGYCQGDAQTTVAAHSNFALHGKAKGRKADDEYTAWACAGCHAWLDQGPAARTAKERAFHWAHERQVLAWMRIAVDAGADRRDVEAARWALARLGVVYG